MKTRQQYMDTPPKYGTPESTAHHRAYFAQFVTPHVKAQVLARFGIKRLKANAKDPHFNTIPLSEWDAFWGCYDRGMYIRPPAPVAELLKRAGEDNSMSTGTCILKEAARQLVEEAGK